MDGEQRVTREALRAYFPRGGLGRRIVALPEHGCVYVKNLKAGCSTVTLWLHRIHTGDHEFVPQSARHAEFGTPHPGQIGWNRVTRMLSGDAFRFTFVRDPIRRAESAYRDKIVNTPEETFRDRVRQTLELDGDAPVTLDVFVDALEVGDPVQMDAHWRPQHLNLMHPVVTYDLVGRLENLAADLERVRDACDLPDVAVVSRNPSTRVEDRPIADRPDLLRRVSEVYGRDFELYGY
ncbi:MAG: sulfotransferase family protein [Nocardioides sp.]